MKIDRYYDAQMILHRATITKGDIFASVCAETEDELCVAIDEAIQLIEEGKITKPEPVFYNADEAAIDKQLMAMRPKEHKLSRVVGSSDYSNSTDNTALILAVAST